MERTDDNGRWLIQDDGVELLVEPSAAWLAAHQAPEDPSPSDPLAQARAEMLDAFDRSIEEQGPTLSMQRIVKAVREALAP